MEKFWKSLSVMDCLCQTNYGHNYHVVGHLKTSASVLRRERLSGVRGSVRSGLISLSSSSIAGSFVIWIAVKKKKIFLRVCFSDG